MDDKYLDYLKERISILKSLSDKYFQEYSRCASEKDDESARDAYESFRVFGYGAAVLSDVLFEFRSL